ncbi:MAG: hypothetical protein ABSC65_11655 [Acidobacteriaceae bacterium]
MLHKVPKRLGRVIYERLPEPLHLNVLSIFVALFGNYRMRIACDLVVRQQYAFSLLKTAELAMAQGLKSVTVIEFGVAAGAGLVNICNISRNITKLTGIDFQIIGFDSGVGMPPPRDHRDHPEVFSEGSFPLIDRSALMRALPHNAKLILGDIQETLPDFMAGLSASSPVGFVVIDVDYYWSAKECLKVFLGEADNYLPWTLVYLDDIGFESSNPWAGELLAVREFNEENEMRKIHLFEGLRHKRLFKHTSWFDQVYLLHVLDHGRRSVRGAPKEVKVLTNLYL